MHISSTIIIHLAGEQEPLVPHTVACGIQLYFTKNLKGPQVLISIVWIAFRTERNNVMRDALLILHEQKRIISSCWDKLHVYNIPGKKWGLALDA